MCHALVWGMVWLTFIIGFIRSKGEGRGMLASFPVAFVIAGARNLPAFEAGALAAVRPDAGLPSEPDREREPGDQNGQDQTEYNHVGVHLYYLCERGDVQRINLTFLDSGFPNENG